MRRRRESTLFPSSEAENSPIVAAVPDAFPLAGLLPIEASPLAHSPEVVGRAQLRDSDDSIISRELLSSLHISRKRSASERAAGENSPPDSYSEEDEAEGDVAMAPAHNGAILRSESSRRAGQAPLKRARLHSSSKSDLPVRKSSSFPILAAADWGSSVGVHPDELSDVLGPASPAPEDFLQQQMPPLARQAERAGTSPAGGGVSPDQRGARRASRRRRLAESDEMGIGDPSALIAMCTHVGVFGPFPNVHPLEKMLVTAAPAVLRTRSPGLVAIPIGSVLKADGWAVLPSGKSSRLFSVLHLSDIAGTTHPMAQNSGSPSRMGENSSLTEGTLEPSPEECTIQLHKCSECKSWVPLHG
jgi:hypothetical protein